MFPISVLEAGTGKECCFLLQAGGQVAYVFCRIAVFNTYPLIDTMGGCTLLLVKVYMLYNQIIIFPCI